MRDKKDIKVVYLHGLESSGVSSKNTFLHELFGTVYDPVIDYRKQDAWEKILNQIIKIKPDYIIGSSMGGWFAYKLGKLLNIKTILFNPALMKRTYEPYIPIEGLNGIYKPYQIIVLGKNDKHINPKDTTNTLIKNKDELYTCIYTNDTHRTSKEVFKKILINYCN